MELSYVVEYDDRVTQRIRELGFDLESICYLCKDLLGLQKELNLENGDLKDFIFRLRNRYDHLNGVTCDLKLRCEDMSPSRITYQPAGSRNLFYFIRCPGQNDVLYKEAVYFCEMCGGEYRLRKKEIKVHVNNCHKISLISA